MDKRNRAFNEFVISGSIFLAVLLLALWVMFRDGDYDSHEKPQNPSRSALEIAEKTAITPKPTGMKPPPPAAVPGTVKKTAGTSFADLSRSVARREAESKPPVDPESDEAQLMAKAIQAVDLGNAQEAESLLLKVLEADPDNETALVELSMLYLIDKKEPEAAIPYLERAVKNSPQNQTMVNELISAAEKTDQLPDVIAFLESQNGSGVMDQGLARAYDAQDQPEQSINHLNKALEKGQGDPASLFEDLGDAYKKTGDSAKALEHYRSAMEKHKQKSEESPGDPVAKEQHIQSQIKYARSLLDSGRKDEAAQVVNQIRIQNPDNPAVHDLLQEVTR